MNSQRNVEKILENKKIWFAALNSNNDFCATFGPMFAQALLPKRSSLTWKTRMQLSELMTIVVIFHVSKFLTFKDFDIYQSIFLQRYFPSLMRDTN